MDLVVVLLVIGSPSRYAETPCFHGVLQALDLFLNFGSPLVVLFRILEGIVDQVFEVPGPLGELLLHLACLVVLHLIEGVLESLAGLGHFASHRLELVSDHLLQRAAAELVERLLPQPLHLPAVLPHPFNMHPQLIAGLATLALLQHLRLLGSQLHPRPLLPLELLPRQFAEADLLGPLLLRLPVELEHAVPEGEEDRHDQGVDPQ